MQLKPATKIHGLTLIEKFGSQLLLPSSASRDAGISHITESYDDKHERKMFSYFFTECNVYAVDGRAYDASQKAGWMDGLVDGGVEIRSTIIIIIEAHISCCSCAFACQIICLQL